MLIKTHLTPNKVSATVHVVHNVDYIYPNDFLLVTVHSFTTQEDMLSGVQPVWASDPLQMPLVANAVDFLAGVEAWLVTDQSSPFVGATTATLINGDLVSRKLKKWAGIKGVRDAEIAAGFDWDGSRFDSDLQSQIFIEGAALLATLALIGSQPFQLDFTLQDNSVRTLSGADMLAVGQAMGTHFMTTHGIGRALRTAIQAATTTEELEAIQWPERISL